MQLLVVVEAVEDLLLGLVADGAGVVEDQAGFFFGLDLAIALVQQCANDLFGVMGIHLAPESLKVEGFFGCHSNSEYRAFRLSQSPCESAQLARDASRYRPFLNTSTRNRTVLRVASRSFGNIESTTCVDIALGLSVLAAASKVRAEAVSSEGSAMAIEVQGVAPLVQVFDMPRSIRFYRDLLGFKVTGNSKAKSADPDDVDWAMLQLSNATIMLNTAYDPDDVPEAPDAGALVRAPGHLPLLRLSRCRRRLSAPRCRRGSQSIRPRWPGTA